jgi:26S proteasome regulatory subunit N9
VKKIKLMALLELVFNTSVSNRTISFETISKFTDTDIEDVEELILSALAINLIKGVIDEVLQNVTVSWCQPRVLDLSQIKNVNNNISLWLEKVQNTLKFLETQGSLKNDVIE